MAKIPGYAPDDSNAHMHLNTLKTVAGFCRSYIDRHTPFGRKQSTIESVYNYLPINKLYATSGQPSEAQFEKIRDAGYETVINLAPTSRLENSLVNECDVLAGLGLKYVHIPVDFKNPTDEDFAKFVASVEQHPPSKVWVHCAANMRVSAFTYRYRLTVRGEDKKTAATDLQKIWRPIGVWQDFIQR